MFLHCFLVEAKRPKNDEELPTCSLIDVEMTSPEELNKSTCLADITPEHSEHCDLKSIERSISTEFNPQISLPVQFSDYTCFHNLSFRTCNFNSMSSAK